MQHQIKVTLTKFEHSVLKKLAKDENRTLSQEVAYLITTYNKAREINPPSNPFISSPAPVSSELSPSIIQHNPASIAPIQTEEHQTFKQKNKSIISQPIPENPDRDSSHNQ